MKIAHLAAHLGGGVGKAHAAIRGVDPRAADHTYLLLESPRDRRYCEAIEASGANLMECPEPALMQRVLSEADIIQVEFWNHPRLYEVLAKTSLPAGRYVFWCHISGLAPPLVAEGLIEAANAFVFTSACSLRPGLRGNLSVIGSGFGFDNPRRRSANSDGKVVGGYLGTVDFVKMSPDFFAAVDAIDADNFEIRVYGACAENAPPTLSHHAMRHPERVSMMGQTDDPAGALSQLDFFFYPLARGHFGTAENALVEAMSAGLAPLVLDNPAEMAIVSHGETGLVAADLGDLSQKLSEIIGDRRLRERLGDAAAKDAQRRFRPEVSRDAFAALYARLAATPRATPDFGSVLGRAPLDWYLGSFPDGSAKGLAPSKGSLTHFQACFPHDEGLNRYARAADELHRREE